MATTAYEYFAGRQNARIVKFLERNESVASFVQALADELSEFCEKNKIRPEDIELELPYIAHDEHIRARVRRLR